mgnify:CR=1 FL=1
MHSALGAVFALIVVVCAVSPKVWELIRVLILGPIFGLLIWGEEKLSGCFSLRFPRSLAELLSDPQPFFRLVRRQVGVHAALRDPSPLAADATLASCARLRELTTEPMKNATTFPLELTLADGATLAVFVKLQCGRGAPLWLQAVTKAVELGMQRESDFYKILAAHVPIRVPRPYAIDRIDVFNRCCLVLECIEGGKAIADWEGCPLPAIGAMLRDAAKLHAQFLECTSTSAATRWIPSAAASRSAGALHYVKWIGDLTSDHKASFRRVWSALNSHPFFAPAAGEGGDHDAVRSPLALVHGDCRPGNMLFLGALDDADAPPSVVFADWEAVNVAPPLWDVIYCTTLGVDPDKHDEMTVATLREEYARELLATAEHASPGSAAGKRVRALYDPDTAEGVERIVAEGKLLLLVLAFVSYTVVKKNLWNQGNTNDDNVAWRASTIVYNCLHLYCLQPLRSLCAHHSLLLSFLPPPALNRIARLSGAACVGRRGDGGGAEPLELDAARSFDRRCLLSRSRCYHHLDWRR